MSEEISNKKKVALSARAIDKMKIGDSAKSDIGGIYWFKSDL